MRFINLHMENFRGTRELDIGFEPDMTVIVGRNGAGKTSLLDALGIMMGFARAHLNGPYRNNFDLRIVPQDIREDAERFVLNLTYEIEKSEANSREIGNLEIVFFSDGHRLHYEISKKLRQWSKTIEFQPRFIHYRQERGFEPKRSRRYADDAKKVLDPESVQTLSLNEDLQAIGDLEIWWDRRDAQEARRVRDGERDYRDPQLEAIRNLIAKIDSFSDITFMSTASPPGLHFIKNDGTPVHVGSLSGGERSYIILLADLARRLQVFAPDKSLEEIPAIVLIDEIELNLHPAWQSEILPTLRGVFEACQFIVTTHSPQVLSGVESSKVRMIEEDVSGWSWKVTVPLSTRGRTSNYLLEGVLGASERYPPVDAIIASFNVAIDKSDITTAAKKLAKIEKEIGDDAPTLLVLRKRLKSLQGSA